MLKLQEVPENLPQGEMPRHLQLYCDRSICERVVPGNRVTVLGIYSIKKVAKSGASALAIIYRVFENIRCFLVLVDFHCIHMMIEIRIGDEFIKLLLMLVP